MSIKRPTFYQNVVLSSHVHSTVKMPPKANKKILIYVVCYLYMCINMFLCEIINMFTYIQVYLFKTTMMYTQVYTYTRDDHN